MNFHELVLPDAPDGGDAPGFAQDFNPFELVLPDLSEFRQAEEPEDAHPYPAPSALDLESEDGDAEAMRLAPSPRPDAERALTRAAFLLNNANRYSGEDVRKAHAYQRLLENEEGRRVPLDMLLHGKDGA
ncbi:MAG: hypothetical protein LBH94_07595, partial [Deltaproteobacteria bacterium]|nr:hypothetical protein [Deltaproteobacteria bacterium]